MGLKTATIGFFDGVHRGHRFLMNGVDLIVTFRQHPAEVLCPEKKPKLLNTFDEKAELLRSVGAEDVIVLDFNKSLANMTAKDFLEILRDKYGVERLVMGYDHRFGVKGIETGTLTGADYSELGKELGVEVVKGEEFRIDGEKVSSTAIRQLIAEGQIEKANLMLGYDYFIEGKVISGKMLGRTIGFPTANLEVSEEKLLPLRGAYECRVKLDEKRETRAKSQKPRAKSFLRGMVNVGDIVEVNIFDFDEDIYGERLRVEFVRRLRDEMYFASLDELKEQLIKDKAEIECN